MDVRARGVAGVVRSLNALAGDLDRLDLTGAGRPMVQAARAGIISRTGRLAGTVRAEAEPGELTITAGGPGVPYAGVINFGGYHNITPRHYMERAAAVDIRPQVEGEIRGLIRNRDLT